MRGAARCLEESKMCRRGQEASGQDVEERLAQEPRGVVTLESEAPDWEDLGITRN